MNVFLLKISVMWKSNCCREIFDQPCLQC